MRTRQDFLSEGYAELVRDVAYLWPGTKFIGLEWFCDVFAYCWGSVPEWGRGAITENLRNNGFGGLIVKVHALQGGMLGCCTHDGDEIRIDPRAIQMCPEAVLCDTIWHELAHAFDFAKTSADDRLMESLQEDWAVGSAEYRECEKRACQIQKQWQLGNGTRKVRYPYTLSDRRRLDEWLPDLKREWDREAEFRARYKKRMAEMAKERKAAARRVSENPLTD